MEKIDEYLHRARELRARAAGVAGEARREMEVMAEHWDQLAKERLDVLQSQLDQGKLNWNATA